MTSKSEAECEEAIKEFAKLTNTDEAFAHSILQDCDFDLEEGVFRFFTEISPDTPLPEQIIKEVLNAPQSRGTSELVNGLPRELSVVSWNIDGLNKDALMTRFVAALNVVAKHNPEVIFFQEFVVELDKKMREVLGKMYHIFEGSQTNLYYTVTLVSKNITIVNARVISFDSSGMGRNMNVVEAKWHDLHIRLVNSHLESGKDHSSTRKSQFKQCMNVVEQMTSDKTFVLFGGDLNLRDSEVGIGHGTVTNEQVGPVPRGVEDCWEMAGGKEKDKFTWDMSRNDNLDFPSAARRKMRFRFDRLYYSGPYSDVSFSLDGLQRIQNVRMYPSDHFALCCKFRNPR